MLIFPDAEHIATIFCLWFRFTKIAQKRVAKGFMICREPVDINPKLFAIMKMVLINHSKIFRQELQGDAIIDR